MIHPAALKVGDRIRSLVTQRHGGYEIIPGMSFVIYDVRKEGEKVTIFLSELPGIAVPITGHHSFSLI